MSYSVSCVSLLLGLYIRLLKLCLALMDGCACAHGLGKHAFLFTEVDIVLYVLYGSAASLLSPLGLTDSAGSLMCKQVSRDPYSDTPVNRGAWTRAAESGVLSNS